MTERSIVTTPIIESSVHEMIGRLVCAVDDSLVPPELAKDLVLLLRSLKEENAKLRAEVDGTSVVDLPPIVAVPIAPPEGSASFTPSPKQPRGFGACSNGCGVMTSNASRICAACAEEMVRAAEAATAGSGS